MMRLFTPVIIVAGVIGAALLSTAVNKNTPPIQNEGVAVLELFTSQGCSSCPPADELLGQYAGRNSKQVIALAFHVDYWNRLGWKDSFSNALYSQRQRDYAGFLGSESVYTPQLIINGHKEFVGSNATAIAAAVANELSKKPLVQLQVFDIKNEAGVISFKYKATGETANTLIEAVLVQKMAVTHIKAGENNGVNLTNYNAVRDFIKKDAGSGDNNITLHLPVGIRANNFNIVIMARNSSSGAITGALQSALDY